MRGRGARALGTLAATALLVATAAPVRATASAEVPARTPIRHFVMLMQENHSFDNYFGTYPGADGIPPRVCVPRRTGKPSEGCVKPYHLGSTAPPDHAHDYRTALRQYHGGKLDGFVWALRVRHQDGRGAMGYYDRRELPFHWSVADQYVLFDRFFSSSLRGGAVNHMYWVAGQPRADDAVPTIFDRLQARGVSWKFYIAGYDPRLNARTPPSQRDAHWTRVSDDVPILKMTRFADDPRLASHFADLNDYYKDLQEGTLPAVSFMVSYGTSEHPAGSLDQGQRLIRSLVNSLMASSAWKDSAFMWTYDDWGGWYDHVAPPQVDVERYGFRVPALLVSSFARKGYIDHTQLDQTAGIKFIEENWGLKPLAQRDKVARTFLGAFDFASPPRTPSLIPMTPAGVEPAVVKRPPVRLLYGFYAGAFVFSLVVLGLTMLRSRGRHPLARWSRRSGA